MHKLYQKSEIWFAILWIIVYVVGTSVADAVSEAAGMAKSVTLLFHIALSAIALVWLSKHGLRKKYGLCKTETPASRFLYYIPLIAIASCNLWFGVALNLPAHEALLYIGSMICVGFLEELIFRGFLFKAMSRNNIKSAVLVSSITFGIGHIVNLINGSGADIVSNLCQICYATAFGFLFVILFHRGKSLLPCIIAHSTLNALSVFSSSANISTGTIIVVSVVLTVVALAYAFLLLKLLPKQQEE